MGKNISKQLTKNVYKSLDTGVLDLNINEDLSFRDKNNTTIGFNIGVQEETKNYLINKFNLENKEKFNLCFRQVVSGDGNEITKISALASSSLCALLTFYNISKDKPFRIKYDDGKKHIFNNVYFEIKNKVIKNPSNMDVVLTNDETKEILFIECKFSEYLSKSKYKLGEGYKEEKYKKIFDEIGYNNIEVFQYGIKQLVSHFIGINNYIKGYNDSEIHSFYGENDYGRKEIYLKEKYNNVAFMEVIFKHEGDLFSKYVEGTEKTFEILKKYNKCNINILGNKTYQEIFSGENSIVLNEKVRKFYKLG